jgi:hypothetical protein
MIVLKATQAKGHVQAARSCRAPRSCRVVCVAVVVLARYGHPLRFYITPHFTKWWPVAAPGLRLVSSTAVRPLGFIKPILCKVPALGAGASAVGAPRSHPRPTHHRLAALVVRVALWHWSGAPRCGLGVACGQFSCVCPAHPWASPRFAGLGPALGLPVRPQGAPSAQR